jgi:hypothetical protein
LFVTEPSVNEPKVHVEQVSHPGGADREEWLVSWRIKNLGIAPLEVLASRLPHSQFWSGEQELNPSPTVLPDESFLLERSVRCSEPAGAAVENAFLILRVIWMNESWRIFARFRVVFNEEGAPNTVTELTTTQRIGFSARKDEL